MKAELHRLYTCRNGTWKPGCGYPKASSAVAVGRRYAIHERRYLWLYVAVILSYGLFSTVGRDVSIVAILALNTTTGLLHYYFDSFIWRVRRAEFREHL